MRANTLSGKTALVTGAARRIGRAIALDLADAGVNVVLHYRGSVEEAGQVLAEVARRGVGGWPLQADLGKAEECAALIGRALELAGGLDILVNSASIFPPGTLAEAGFDDLVQAMRVNTWAPFVLSREFARLVGRGKIVNLLDTRITGYDWSHVAYLLSKQALAALTRMTALAYAPGITVNAVAPGLILPPPGQDEGYLERLALKLPLRRHGSAEDVAAAVLYLLQSDFVTGQVLYVDGGRHLKEYGGGPHPDH